MHTLVVIILGKWNSIASMKPPWLKETAGAVLYLVYTRQRKKQPRSQLNFQFRCFGSFSFLHQAFFTQLMSRYSTSGDGEQWEWDSLWDEYTLLFHKFGVMYNYMCTYQKVLATVSHQNIQHTYTAGYRTYARTLAIGCHNIGSWLPRHC